jgi:hypothetical protein
MNYIWIIHHEYIHDTLRSAGMEDTNQQFPRMLLARLESRTAEQLVWQLGHTQVLNDGCSLVVNVRIPFNYQSRFYIEWTVILGTFFYVCLHWNRHPQFNVWWDSHSILRASHFFCICHKTCAQLTILVTNWNFPLILKVELWETMTRQEKLFPPPNQVTWIIFFKLQVCDAKVGVCISFLPLGGLTKIANACSIGHMPMCPLDSKASTAAFPLFCNSH